jgi:hypothetical protein
VFSAGILLWELVALQRFWNQLPQYEVRRRLVAFDIPDIARLKPHVGGELARICRQALAADPAQRYPSAAPLAVELERFLVERSAVASPAALALVMKKACCALQREARERLSTALDAVQGGAQRRSEAPSEVGIWHVLTKERPMSSSKAAWVAGALGVLTIAVAAQIARTQASSASDAQPVAIEPITLEAASPEAVLPSSGSLQAASLQAMPLPDPAGEGMAASPPERRSPSTTIQTLMPERPRPSPASVASRAKLERVEAVLERRRLAEPEPRARRARRLPESTPSPSLDEAAPPSREAPTLTIRLER